MVNFSLIERIISYFALRRAVRQLGSGNAARVNAASERLQSAGLRSWRLLRRSAFGSPHIGGLRASALLYNMGDDMGLWALMEMYAKPHLTPELADGIRQELLKVGNSRIVECMETAIDHIEQGRFVPNTSSLALCEYALNAIRMLAINLTEGQWLRLLTLRGGAMDDPRVCRAITPVLEDRFTLTRVDAAVWPPGSSLAQVRRLAIDILLDRHPDRLLYLLKQVITSQDVDIQLTAIHGLWRLGDRRAIVLLQPVAANRHHRFCREARRAIQSFGISEPDELTLLRASSSNTPDTELLRVAGMNSDPNAGQLLRPGAALARVPTERTMQFDSDT